MRGANNKRSNEPVSRRTWPGHSNRLPLPLATCPLPPAPHRVATNFSHMTASCFADTVQGTGCQQGHVGQLVNRSFAASYKSPHHRQRQRQRSRLNISHDIFDRFRLTRNKPTKHFVHAPASPRSSRDTKRQPAPTLPCPALRCPARPWSVWHTTFINDILVSAGNGKWHWFKWVLALWFTVNCKPPHSHPNPGRGKAGCELYLLAPPLSLTLCKQVSSGSRVVTSYTTWVHYA